MSGKSLGTKNLRQSANLHRSQDAEGVFPRRGRIEGKRLAILRLVGAHRDEEGRHAEPLPLQVRNGEGRGVLVVQRFGQRSEAGAEAGTEEGDGHVEAELA